MQRDTRFLMRPPMPLAVLALGWLMLLAVWLLGTEVQAGAAAAQDPHQPAAAAPAQEPAPPV